MKSKLVLALMLMSSVALAPVFLAPAPVSAAELLDPIAVQPYAVVVTSSDVPIRCGDSTMYYPIAMTKAMDGLIVDGETKNWLRVRYPVRTGEASMRVWVKGDDVTEPSPGIVRLKRPVKVMAHNLNADVKGSFFPVEPELAAGTELKVIKTVIAGELPGVPGTMHAVVPPDTARGYIVRDQVRRATPKETESIMGAAGLTPEVVNTPTPAVDAPKPAPIAETPKPTAAELAEAARLKAEAEQAAKDKAVADAAARAKAQADQAAKDKAIADAAAKVKAEAEQAAKDKAAAEAARAQAAAEEQARLLREARAKAEATRIAADAENARIAKADAERVAAAKAATEAARLQAEADQAAKAKAAADAALAKAQADEQARLQREAAAKAEAARLAAETPKPTPAPVEETPKPAPTGPVITNGPSVTPAEPAKPLPIDTSPAKSLPATGMAGLPTVTPMGTTPTAPATPPGGFSRDQVKAEAARIVAEQQAKAEAARAAENARLQAEAEAARIAAEQKAMADAEEHARILREARAKAEAARLAAETENARIAAEAAGKARVAAQPVPTLVPAPAPVPLVAQPGRDLAGDKDGPDAKIAPVATRVQTINELAALYNRVRLQPAETAELEQCIVEFEKFNGTLTSSENDQRLAKAIQNYIEAMKLRIDLRDAKRATAAASRNYEATASDLTPKLIELEKQRVYNVIGRLTRSTVYDGNKVPMLYRIASPESGSSRTLGYLVPDDKLDLTSKLEQVVGIIGEIRPDESLRTNLIVPKRVDVVSLAPISMSPPLPVDEKLKKPAPPLATPEKNGQ